MDNIDGQYRKFQENCRCCHVDGLNQTDQYITVSGPVYGPVYSPVYGPVYTV